MSDEKAVSDKYLDLEKENEIFMVLDPASLRSSGSKLEALSGGFMVSVPTGSIEYLRTCISEMLIRSMGLKIVLLGQKKSHT